jgi:uncharacterized OB-fold protein
MTGVPAKPLPRPTPLTRPFWEGCRLGELRLQRCTGCGRFRFFPSEACHLCGAPDYTWEAVEPAGRVYSWIVVRRAVDEAWAGDVPFAVVVVRLDVPGEPLLTGTLTGCPLDAIEAGMEVRAEFEAVNEDISLLRWRPVTGG